MINSIVHFILTAFVKIMSFLLQLILFPLTALINNLFPNIVDYFSYFNYLLNTYLFNGLKFAREVIFNLTGLNRNMVGILFLIPLTYFSFSMANLSIRFLISIWRIWKKGGSD